MNGNTENRNTNTKWKLTNADQIEHNPDIHSAEKKKIPEHLSKNIPVKIFESRKEWDSEFTKKNAGISCSNLNLNLWVYVSNVNNWTSLKAD